MRYRLGILSGIAIIGIIALALATGISGSGTVEAAKPAVTVTTHSLCNYELDVDWAGNAYAHKKGIYRLFLFTDVGPKVADFPIEKGTLLGTITEPWGPPAGAEIYTYRVVFYTTKGKNGGEIGRPLALYDFEPICP